MYKRQLLHTEPFEGVPPLTSGTVSYTHLDVYKRQHETHEEAAEEISQLLYHLQVMMIAKGMTLEDVYKHL